MGRWPWPVRRLHPRLTFAVPPVVPSASGGPAPGTHHCDTERARMRGSSSAEVLMGAAGGHVPTSSTGGAASSTVNSDSAVTASNASNVRVWSVGDFAEVSPPGDSVWRRCEIVHVDSINIRVRYASKFGEQLYDCPRAGLHIRDGADVYDMPFCESVVTRILQGPPHPDSVDICTLFVYSHMGNHMTRNVLNITLLHVSPSLGREFLDPQTGVRTDPPQILFFTVSALLVQYGCVVPHRIRVVCT